MRDPKVRAALVFIQTVFILSKCETIWNDPLNSTNGAYIDWELSGAVDPPYTGISPELLCPSANGCWRFTETSSAYYISSSVHYYNISVTYSVSGDGDACHIYYSIDKTTDWIQIDTSWTTNSVQSFIMNLPSDASNNEGVGIKISSQQNYCYFSDIIFEGERAPNATNEANNLFEYILSLSLMVIVISAAVVVIVVVILVIICCKMCNKKSARKNTKEQMHRALDVNSNSDVTKTDKTVYGSDIVEVHTNGTENVDSNPVDANDAKETDTKRVSEKPEAIVVADGNHDVELKEERTRDESESGDSLMRKQRQYEFEEECEIEEDGDINTPLPDFQTNLNLGVTTESVVLEHIMNDMKNSQLKLQTQKENDPNIN